MVLVIICVTLFRGNVIATAGYADSYTRTFGKFTAKTANILMEGKGENVCYSPVSVFAALSLAAETTKGEARKEIVKALGVRDIEELEEMYAKMLEDVVVEPDVTEIVDEEETKAESDSETTKPKLTIGRETKKQPSQIRLCNSLWIEKAHKIDGADEAISDCEEKLDCEVFECDKIEADDVNRWVSNKTNGLIPVILPVSTYSMVLANAVYYKANWGYEFSEVSDSDFFLENGKTEQVPYIQCSMKSMDYKQKKDYTAVSVPMDKGEMLFVLPDENVKLEELLGENKLNEIIALSSNDRMDRGLVNITLPIYECEYDFEDNIEDAVKEIGIKRMFDGDQWKVVSEDSSFDVDIRQKTNIKVTEDGVEAAAATYVSVEYISAGQVNEPDLVITLDRPFLYVLVKDGVPLFIGTVYNPNEAK